MEARAGRWSRWWFVCININTKYLMMYPLDAKSRVRGIFSSAKSSCSESSKNIEHEIKPYITKELIKAKKLRMLIIQMFQVFQMTKQTLCW
jgi:hypothetical protein